MDLGKEIFQINVEDIIPNRFQPRLTFDETALNELADSIKQHGIIQPLVLRKLGDKYEIIAGERRYKASQIVGLKTVPAIVVNLDDNTSAEIALIENVQRKDLTPIEEAKSYKKLLDIGATTQDQLAHRMGKSQSAVANKIRLLNLPSEVQAALLQNKISERHARSLLTLKDETLQREILNQIISQRLTVRQTDDLIKKRINNTEEPKMDNNQNIKDIPNLTSDTININDLENNPVIENNQEVKNDPFTGLSIEEQPSNIFNDVEPVINENLEKTQMLDINQIKEQAENINQPHAAPDFDALLRPANPTTEASIATPVEINKEPNKIFNNSFFPSLEEEPTEMNINTIEENPNPEFPSFDNLIKEEITTPETPVEANVNPSPISEINQEINPLPTETPSYSMNMADILKPNIEENPTSEAIIDEPAEIEITPLNLNKEELPEIVEEPIAPVIPEANVQEEITPDAVIPEPVVETSSPVAQKKIGAFPGFDEDEKAQVVQPKILTSRIRNAINMTRNLVNGLEREGYQIDTDEMDLMNEYKIIITIEK